MSRPVGRPTWDKSIQLKRLWDLSIPVLVHALLSKKKVPEFKKIEIALALISKMIPQDQNLGGSVDVNINITKPDISQSELSGAGETVYGFRASMATNN
jgi:hypothetical protein